jgi:hypothetical protein
LWQVAVDTMNKQPGTADKGWSSSWDGSVRGQNSLPQN